MCRSKDFTTVNNKQNERVVKSLRVFCTNKDKGCDWQGEINNITGHLEGSDGCSFEEVKCSNDCGLLLQRQHIPDHVDNECPYRQVHCQYCNVLAWHQFIKSEHVKQCPKFPLPCPNNCGIGDICREDMEHHRQKCPLEVVQCEYYSVGCHVTMVRKDMHIHEKKKMEEHLLLTKCEFLLTKSELMDTKAHYKTKVNELETGLQQSLTKINELESETCKNAVKVNKLETELQQNHTVMKLLFGEWTIQLNTRAAQLLSGDQVLPVVVRMSEYMKKLRNVDWYSEPFYTHKGGYKIQLNVVANGCNTTDGNYLSVYLHFLRGPHDDMLPWPLKRKFKVTLLNQTDDTKHHSVARYVTTDQLSWCGTRTMWEREFIKTTTLRKSEYLKNDSLFFEVAIISS